ncbi:MAG: LVIVD repeat-containing protein [bacterium]
MIKSFLYSIVLLFLFLIMVFFIEYSWCQPYPQNAYWGTPTVYGPISYGNPLAPPSLSSSGNGIYTGIYSAPPLNPLPTDQIETVRSMEVKDNYVFYVLETGMAYETPKPSLQIVDINNPEKPVTVSSIKLDYPISDIVIQGNYLYWLSDSHLWNMGYNLSVDEYILGTIDISNPVSPTMADTIKLKFSQGTVPFNMAFSENRLYVVYRKIEGNWDEVTQTMITIDNSDPANLVQQSLGTMEIDDIIDKVCIKDNRAFICCSNIYIFDISNPENLNRISSIRHGESHFEDIAVFDDYLVIAVEYEGLRIMDIKDMSKPTLITTIEMSCPKEIIIKNHYAYISDHCKGLYVVDLTDPKNPELLSGYRLPSFKVYRSTPNGSEYWLSDMEVADGLTLTLTHSNIQIWDISERGNIQEVSTIGASSHQDNVTESIIPGRLILLLSQNAQESINLAQNGNSATFGIDSLDELNRKYGVYRITHGTSSEIPEIMEDYNNYKERIYLIEFRTEEDIFSVWDAYMDNPDCLIAEFIYESNSFLNAVTVSPQTATVIQPLYGRDVGGSLNSPSAGAFNPYSYSANPFRGITFPQTISPISYSLFGLNNPFQNGFGLSSGFINNVAPWAPLSFVSPRSNLQLPTQSYLSSFPYALWNSSISNPFFSNSLKPIINSINFNDWNFYQ